MPFLAGMSLLIAGIRMYTGNMLLGLGLLLVLVVNAGGILHMARAISLTREKRRELEGLLSQMD